MVYPDAMAGQESTMDVALGYVWWHGVEGPFLGVEFC
jgi:hypothetical protein